MPRPKLCFKQFSGLQDYAPIFRQMREFTHSRTPETPLNDQVWFLEHSPVYTQGQAGKPEHFLLNQPAPIPLIHSDRGGQITYHGPGQLMVYLLLNLKKYGFQAKSYVHFLEHMIVALFKKYDINAVTQADAPGVYIALPDGSPLKKIASIGIRIRKNFSYHGLCLNISGDLSPFMHIHPCGYKNLKMIQLHDMEQTKHLSMQNIINDLTAYLTLNLEVLEHV